MRSFVILMIAALLIVGCGSTPGGTVRVVRMEDGRGLQQRFDQAAIMQGEHGDYDLVMIAEMTAGQAHRGRGNTLTPAESAPVRHVVHVRIFWRPLRGVRSDDTATSNAAIDWFVLTPGAREGEDFIRYRGSGLVAVNTSENGASVTLRNVRLEPDVVRGQMSDPIGQAAVSGSIQARWDKAFVENVIEEMRGVGK